MALSDAEDSARRAGSGFDEPWLWVSYEVGGWVVTARAQVDAPFEGPQELSVALDMSEEGFQASVEAAESTGGITAAVLRSVPLGDARKVLRRMRADALAHRDLDDRAVYTLPRRMVTDDDWRAFARAYARAASRNPGQPIPHLAGMTGLSVHTIAARLRRAREMGLLVDRGDGWFVLPEEETK
ncbi:hypothetical protein P5P86_16745 [Nocardioides sp. BP30]|uniref:hypothetical protein n=1 Tax=Nocardioides sp. BP30 TaxID=3036374 RepID=UPI0024689D14|nr:hypothetical protein [Nocardioides sp. BP30]WGL51598.1 hypothetical protein P5P86_16745 [Nocardioides sp. BP30]